MVTLFTRTVIQTDYISLPVLFEICVESSANLLEERRVTNFVTGGFEKLIFGAGGVKK